MVRPAFAIVFALGLTGCVFLVDSLPDDTSTTCHLTTPAYTSADNACSTCIRANCQSMLNACCADSSCQTQLNNVDSCADQSGCAALAAAGGTEGATTDLISCIANACGANCFGIDASAAADGSPSTCSSCKTDCATSSADQDCSCVAASAAHPANSVSCDDYSYENGVCCASTGWPNIANGSCACETLFCDDEDGVCTCQIGVSVVGGTNAMSCYPSSSSSCCLSADKSICTCDPNDACDQEGETSVDSCSTTTMPCPTGGSRPNAVSQCSE